MIKLLPLIFLSSLAYGQLVEHNKYDRLVIVDEENINYSIIYGRVFKCNLNDSIHELRLFEEYRSQDSLFGFYEGRIPNFYKLKPGIQNRVIDTIPSHLIDSLIYLINNPTGFKGIIDHLSMDSVWHSEHKSELKNMWQQWANTNKTDRLKTKYGLWILNNWKSFLQLMLETFLQSNTSGYSNVTIAFENDVDTLIISTHGQEFYQIPWKSDTAYVNYNPKLSELVGSLMPQDIIINKSELAPSKDEIVERMMLQLSFEVNFINRKKFKQILRNEKSNR